MSSSPGVPVYRGETPEGVPDGYEYVPPGEEPPEDHDVVESDRGGTYVSPEPEEETQSDEQTVNVENPPAGGFNAQQVLENLQQIIPTADEVRDGELTSEDVQTVEDALPDDREEVVWSEFNSQEVPDKGDVLAMGDTVGVMSTIPNPGDFPDHDFELITPDGKEVVDPDIVTHEFDETGEPQDPSGSGAGGTETGEPQDPSGLGGGETETRTAEEIRDEITDRVNTTAEANEMLGGVDEPSKIGSFENWKEFHDITDDDIVEDGADPPDIVMRTDDGELAQQATETLVEARERGMLEEPLDKIGVATSNLKVPEGAAGAFKPGVRDISGEMVKPTERRTPQVHIDEENARIWGDTGRYTPVDTDEVDRAEFVMYHEIGHFQHYERLINEYDYDIEDIESGEMERDLQSELRPVEDEIEEQFSALAASQPLEFVADMYASLAVGEDFSDEMLEAYEAVGGVPP